MMPWLRPPNFPGMPHLPPPPTSQNEDMAKILRQNIHQMMAGSTGNHKSESPNFPNLANKDLIHPQQLQQPSLTRYVY